MQQQLQDHEADPNKMRQKEVKKSKESIILYTMRYRAIIEQVLNCLRRGGVFSLIEVSKLHGVLNKGFSEQESKSLPGLPRPQFPDDDGNVNECESISGGSSCCNCSFTWTEEALLAKSANLSKEIDPNINSTYKQKKASAQVNKSSNEQRNSLRTSRSGGRMGPVRTRSNSSSNLGADSNLCKLNAFDAQLAILRLAPCFPSLVKLTLDLLSPRTPQNARLKWELFIFLTYVEIAVTTNTGHIFSRALLEILQTVRKELEQGSSIEMLFQKYPSFDSAKKTILAQSMSTEKEELLDVKDKAQLFSQELTLDLERANVGTFISKGGSAIRALTGKYKSQISVVPSSLPCETSVIIKSNNPEAITLVSEALKRRAALVQREQIERLQEYRNRMEVRACRRAYYRETSQHTGFDSKEVARSIVEGKRAHNHGKSHRGSKTTHIASSRSSAKTKEAESFDDNHKRHYRKDHNYLSNLISTELKLID